MRLSGSPWHQSALLLHAMADSDRHWLLQRLDQTERQRLQTLLDELTALGIPSDEKILKQSLDCAGGGNSDAARHDTALRRLLLAAPESLAMLLKAEPDGLIARLLPVHDWPWRDELLARLGSVRAQGIREQMERSLRQNNSDGMPLANTALGHMLVASLLARLEPHAAVPQVTDAARDHTHQRQRVRCLTWIDQSFKRLKDLLK